MPCVALSVRCGECATVNTQDRMPPVAGVGEQERCFCRHCGTITFGEVTDRRPDIELRQNLFGAAPMPIAKPQLVLE